MITNYLHKQNTALILITNYYFSFFNNTALINVFFLFLWQQNEINNMLNLAVANQQRNDLTAQQVLPPIVEGLTRLKLSMEDNISSVPTQRVRHFGRQQRHQGRQPQTSTQRGQHGNDEAGPSISTQPNMYSSTQVGPSTFASNEPTTLSEYNPINVNEYCMNLFQHIGEIPTSIGQRFEGLDRKSVV